jgi:hypothetical protein
MILISIGSFGAALFFMIFSVSTTVFVGIALWSYIKKNSLQRKQLKRLLKLKASINNPHKLDIKKTNDMFDMLMIVSLHFVNWDHEIAKEEMEYIRVQIKSSLGISYSNRGIRYIHKHKDEVVPLKQVEVIVKSSIPYRTKLLFMHYLLGLIMVDGVTTELKALGTFAGNIGIDDKDWDVIKYLGLKKSLSENKIFKEKSILAKQNSVQDAFDTIYAKVNVQDEVLGEQKIKLNAEILLKDLKDEAKRHKSLGLSITKKIELSTNDTVKKQYGLISARLERFSSVLAQKFDVKEATYMRYKGVFEEVFVLALKNLEKVVDIDKLIQEADLSQLKPDVKKSKARKDRLSMYEKEADKQKDILLLNEKVISEMESMIFKMNTLRSQDKGASESMGQSIEELQLWAEKIKLYK